MASFSSSYKNSQQMGESLQEFETEVARIVHYSENSSNNNENPNGPNLFPCLIFKTGKFTNSSLRADLIL